MPPMTLTQIEQARAEYQSPAISHQPSDQDSHAQRSSADPQSLIPDPSASGGYNPAAVRREFAGDIESDFALSVPGRRGTTTDRVATTEQRRLLRRFGTPVDLESPNLPIDDAIKIPTPPTPPPTRPAATFQTVIPTDASSTSRDGQGAAPLACDGRPLPKGMHPREVRVPRPERSMIEQLAQGQYPYLSHEARLLIRLLDTAADSTLPNIAFFGVLWYELRDAFRLPEQDAWEPGSTLWRAIDELVQAQILCVHPGNSKGQRVIFVSEHARRTMLGSMVLLASYEIVVGEIPAHIRSLARDSLRSRTAA